MPTPLIQPDDLIEYLGLDAAAESVARLEYITSFASDFLTAKIGKTDWTSTSRTDVLRGNGTKWLVLRYYPVASVTSVSIKDGSLTTTLDPSDPTVVDLWNAAQGILARTDGDVWPEKDYRNITVVYVGGPTTGVPGYVTGAALELAAYIYQTSGGRMSVSSPEASVTFQTMAENGLLSLPTVAAAISQAQDIVYGDQ